MDILIRGAGFENKGAEAMMRTVEYELGRRLDNARFCIQVTEANAKKMESAGLHLYINPNSKLQKLFSLIKAGLCDLRLIKAAVSNFRASLRIANIKDINAIVDISGFSYADEWGYVSSKLASTLVGYFESRHKPYIFLPQAWGPFTNPLVGKYTKEFVQKASVIYIRDQQSYNYMVKLLGNCNANIKSAPDIAFRFRASAPEVGAALLAKCGVELGQSPVVGIVPNVRVYERIEGSGITNLYVKVMVDVAQYCINELKASVVLLPHEISLGKESCIDDCYLCELIKSAVEEKAEKRIFAMVGEKYSAEDIKSAIGQLYLLVGSRYHSLIAALSSCVPVVALGWSHKYAELMQLVGLHDYILNYTEMALSAVLTKIADAWENRGNNKRILEEHIPAIKSKIDAVFDDAAEIIQKNCL